MENKGKSLNKLWREMGKPTSFKEFAENYNKEVANISFYSSATGVDTTSTTAVSTPTVNASPTINYVIVGALVLGSFALIYSMYKRK
jgi:hypothetical protein